MTRFGPSLNGFEQTSLDAALTELARHLEFGLLLCPGAVVWSPCERNRVADCPAGLAATQAAAAHHGPEAAAPLGSRSCAAL